MPPLAPTGMNKAPQFVVGDRFGQSAGSHFAELLIEQIRLRGFAAAVNHPYAGDHILRHHGQPRRNIHAIQLEVDRSLYLDSALREPGAGLHAISMLISDLVFAMVSMALGHPDAIAAE
jgi:N-formylglutamate amidohydrolase